MPGYYSTANALIRVLRHKITYDRQQVCHAFLKRSDDRNFELLSQFLLEADDFFLSSTFTVQADGQSLRAVHFDQTDFILDSRKSTAQFFQLFIKYSERRML
jgi:hypothetical protein